MNETPRDHDGFADDHVPLDEGVTAAPTEPVKSRKRLIIIGASVAVGLLAVGGVATGIAIAMQPSALEAAGEACSGSKPLEYLYDETSSPSPSPSLGQSGAFDEYFDGAVAVEDEGKTPIVQTQSTDDDPFGVSTLALTCVEDQLEMPTWLSESISTTRSLDGRQAGEWAEFSAQWGYHPDNGLNLIIVAD